MTWSAELPEVCLHFTKNISFKGEMIEENAIFYFKKIFLNIKLYTVNYLFTQTILYHLITHFNLSSHFIISLKSTKTPIILVKQRMTLQGLQYETTMHTQSDFSM